MGLSLSVVLANAFMEDLEDRLLSSSTLKPAVWRRYVDDTWVIWSHGDDALTEFFEHMNSMHDDIIFTKEMEEDGKLPFLDVLVARDGIGGLHTSVYRKAIASDSYIHASSNHAHSIKRAIITNMFDRAKAVCSDRSSLQTEERKLQDIFSRNGYRKEFIQKSSRRTCQAEQQRQSQPNADQPPGPGETPGPGGTPEPGGNQPPGPGDSQPPGPGETLSTSTPVDTNIQSGANQVAGETRRSGSRSNRPHYISMPYVKGVSEPIARFLRAHNAIVGHSSKNLRAYLTNVKDKTVKGKQKGTVYEANVIAVRSI